MIQEGLCLRQEALRVIVINFILLLLQLHRCAMKLLLHLVARPYVSALYPSRESLIRRIVLPSILRPRLYTCLWSPYMSLMPTQITWRHLRSLWYCFSQFRITSFSLRHWRFILEKCIPFWSYVGFNTWYAGDVGHRLLMWPGGIFRRCRLPFWRISHWLWARQSDKRW